LPALLLAPFSAAGTVSSNSGGCNQSFSFPWCCYDSNDWLVSSELCVVFVPKLRVFLVPDGYGIADLVVRFLGVSG
jgi:hypothetical protein